LIVVTPDSFQMSSNDDPATGASASEWETFVFPEFLKQIKTHVGEKTHSLLVDKFSTKTPVSAASHEIVLMSAMKTSFGYGMRTMCDIPSITLRGTEEDKVSLRNRTEALGDLMQKEFASCWSLWFYLSWTS